MDSTLPALERLPAELLHQIFSLAILQPVNNRVRSEADISDGRRWPDVFDYEKGPWSISRVCSRWRIVAISSSDLWCHFMLGTVNLGRSGQQTALKTWLDRSGTHTISFLIQTHRICNHNENSLLFRLLMEHSSRWKSIEVINSTYSLWEMLNTAGVGNRLNSLRRVTMLADGEEDSYMDQGSFEMDMPTYDTFHQAPHLSELISRDFITFCDKDGHPKLPCTQLTTYEGSCRVTYDYHFSVIRHSPNLNSLRLELITGIRGYLNNSRFQWQGGEVFSFPKLRTLTIWIAACQSSDILEEEQMFDEFRLFNLPALEGLSITTEQQTMTAPYHSFAAALRSSDCALQKLELSGCPVQPSDIIDLLRAAHAVRHLCLYGFSSLQHFVISHLVLEGKARDEVLLPFLRTIELKYSTTEGFSELEHPTLVRMIRSRCHSPSTRVNEAHFSFGRDDWGKDYRTSLPLHSPSLDSLKDLQKEGFKLIFRQLCEI
ncbi:hypothetical protein E1B28_007981 [Marasmius oreades]|uniref:F-box domain-containing protein n=1 Tax=Marasmius oreades TaxID=181124 RepID=A0A9P7UVH9_9AGAR|nr:uncharacterized protein E1B28_007981 [Marasmius oreades]KAG7094381.1 hypothetical protein E1B28_007981 [Marasmius oreades]